MAKNSRWAVTLDVNIEKEEKIKQKVNIIEKAIETKDLDLIHFLYKCEQKTINLPSYFSDERPWFLGLLVYLFASGPKWDIGMYMADKSYIKKVQYDGKKIYVEFTGASSCKNMFDFLTENSNYITGFTVSKVN